MRHRSKRYLDVVEDHRPFKVTKLTDLVIKRDKLQPSNQLSSGNIYENRKLVSADYSIDVQNSILPVCDITAQYYLDTRYERQQPIVNNLTLSPPGRAL